VPLVVIALVAFQLLFGDRWYGWVLAGVAAVTLGMPVDRWLDQRLRKLVSEDKEKVGPDTGAKPG
jgi:hypothetical protein